MSGVKESVRTVYEQDRDESTEWLEAYEQVLAHHGVVRAYALLQRLERRLHAYRFAEPLPHGLMITHANAVQSSDVPTDLFDPTRLQYRLTIRWNAVAMVVRAMRRTPEVGGHLASGLSIADLYDIAFEYFFKGQTANQPGDCIYFQGHSSPMIYARSFLEGRLSAQQLDRFRREVGGGGLSSYPHPYWMPDYWQFPTVSMGLGLLQAIHQARIMKYMDGRGLLPLSGRRVWAFVGDGEMREPESVSALNVAAIDGLSHLTVVLNVNLQGLDGLCFGSGSIFSEYASVFEGCGWRVIRVVWNQAWLDLFASESTGVFEAWVGSWVDGDHQNFYCRGPSYLIDRLRVAHPELMPWLEAHQAKLAQLKPGGHDLALIYQAYQEAVNYRGGPTVVIAQTIKGEGLPMASHNIAHQHKKLSDEDLKQWARHCGVPLSEVERVEAHYYRNPDWAGKFMNPQAPIPARYPGRERMALPASDVWEAVMAAPGPCATTASFVRVLGALLRAPEVQKRVVPIVADEARTFGMEGLFKQIGVYSARPARYQSHDAQQLLGYREGPEGQLIQEGVNEAGAMASWLACATAYSTHGLSLIPFYIFYSMFGFQRVMDLIWAAADSRARGFLLGATSGKTTLAGEGLQHADGHSVLLASLVPNLVAYDPVWHQEVVWIIRDGMRRMLCDQEDLIVYMTLVNESVPQRALPAEAEAGALKGMYLFEAHEGEVGPQGPVVLLGSGAVFHEAYRVFDFLRGRNWSVRIYSVTSYPLLRQEAKAAESLGARPYIAQLLPEHAAWVVSVSDYVAMLGEMLRPWVRGRYEVLGTDGFGLSDTRAALRAHFGVNASAIMASVLKGLAQEALLAPSELERCQEAWRRAHEGTL